jgi:hypothetical protein
VQAPECVPPAPARQLLHERELGAVVPLAVAGSDQPGAGARKGEHLAFPALVAGCVEVARDHPRHAPYVGQLAEDGLQRAHLHAVRLLAERRVQAVDLDLDAVQLGSRGEMSLGPRHWERGKRLQRHGRRDQHREPA